LHRKTLFLQGNFVSGQKMKIKKVLLIAIIAGIIETAIWLLLSDDKNKVKTAISLFTLYTAAYVIIAEMERNIPEDEIKYETGGLWGFNSSK
jgi:uncharacterized membrane protein